MILYYFKLFISNIIVLISQFKLTGYLVSSFKGDALVICYHRVMPNSFFNNRSPLNALAVSTVNFEKHIKFLSDYFNVVPLDELYTTKKQFPIVITFDDGYLDNLTNALPILEKYNVPATIYITTNFPEGNGFMWWYSLWDYIKSVSSIDFTYDNQVFNFKTKNYHSKVLAFKKIRNYILSINSYKIFAFINSLTKGSFRDFNSICLNWHQINRLNSHPLITIGAHTQSHPNLSSISSDDVYKELINCKRLIESKLNCSVDHFAYPYGTKRECQDREHLSSFEVGFKTSVTTYNKVFCRNKNSKFVIPRVVVLNTGLNTLKNQIFGFDTFIQKII